MASSSGGSVLSGGVVTSQGWRWALWMGATLGVGVLVWSQVCSGPLEVELARRPLRLGWVSVYLLPLIGLSVGLVLRRGRWAMVGLLGGVVPCFGMLPALDARALNSQAGVLTLALSVVAFVVVAGKLDRDAVPQADSSPLAVDGRFWRLVRLALPRVLLTVAMIVLPLLALYSAQGQAQLQTHFAQRPRDAAFLIHVVHLFVGSVAVYVSVLSPSINRTLDAFELRERLRRERSVAQVRRRRWALGLYALALPVLSLIWWWFS